MNHFGWRSMIELHNGGVMCIVALAFIIDTTPALAGTICSYSKEVILEASGGTVPSNGIESKGSENRCTWKFPIQNSNEVVVIHFESSNLTQREHCCAGSHYPSAPTTIYRRARCTLITPLIIIIAEMGAALIGSWIFFAICYFKKEKNLNDSVKEESSERVVVINEIYGETFAKTMRESNEKEVVINELYEMHIPRKLDSGNVSQATSNEKEVVINQLYEVHIPRKLDSGDVSQATKAYPPPPPPPPML